MAAEFIKEEELVQTFNDAKKFMLPLFQPFDEFERIARNKPHPGIAKELPKVTDGTLAAIIQEQPKRIIQQIPTGAVECKDDWLEIVGSYIFAHEIIPNSNEVAALIQKCWAAISKVLTYGSQPALVQFINRGEYFGTDFSLPYIKDVLYEPGKLSERDSNVIFLRSWWTKSQLQQIITKEKYLGDKAKERNDTYKTGWNVELIKKLIEEGAKQKDAQNMTPSERDKQLNNGFYEIVHCFQRGIGATFYSFAPALGDEDNVVRKKKNPDPRGIIPIHTMYANVDLSNPLGRGSVEMSGGMQNLLDSEVQSYQYMRALLMNPPLKVRGNISPGSLKYAPKAIWNLGVGSKEESDVEPVELSTRSLEQFPQNYGLIKSQILNLNSGGNDNAISASAGDPSSSKTPEGVKTNTARLGISDNYMRKQFETWFSDIAETELNLYFAERHGVQTLELDDDTAAKLKKIQPKAVNEKNEIQIDYDTETPKLKFQVDASSSSMKEDQEQLEAATNVLELCMKYPALDVRQGGPIDVIELADRVIASSGLEDPEKIIVKPETDQNGQPVQQQQPQGMTPEMVQQMIQEAMKTQQKPLHEALGIKFETLSPGVQAQLIKQLFNIDMTDPTLAERKIVTEEQTAQINAIDKAHSHANAQTDQQIKASDAATRVATLSHNEATAQASQDQHAMDLAHQSSESAATRDAQATTTAATLSHQASESEASRKAAAEQAKLAAKSKPTVGAGAK